MGHTSLTLDSPRLAAGAVTPANAAAVPLQLLLPVLLRMVVLLLSSLTSPTAVAGCNALVLTALPSMREGTYACCRTNALGSE